MILTLPDTTYNHGQRHGKKPLSPFYPALPLSHGVLLLGIRTRVQLSSYVTLEAELVYLSWWLSSCGIVLLRTKMGARFLAVAASFRWGWYAKKLMCCVLGAQ